MAVLFVVAGFSAGAAGAAWRQRDERAQPWRKMHLDQEGAKGTTTRTRLVFENPALAVQALELTRTPDGSPELARVVLRDGRELTVRYQKDTRPTSLEAPDGSRAQITYDGAKAQVEFLAADRKPLGAKAVSVPGELRPALREPGAGGHDTAAHSELWKEWIDTLIPEAWAQDADAPVTVVRHVEVGLDVRAPGAGDKAAGVAQVEATCAPFTCVPVSPDIQMPGQSTVRIAVTGSTKRSALKRPPDASAVEPFKRIATAERTAARRVLPDISAVVAAVGVTALACKSLKLAAPTCVTELAKSGAAGGAVHAIASYDIATTGRVVDQRAEELYYVEQARASIDRAVRVQVCVSRDGFVRACSDIDGRPLGPEPMPRVDRAFDLRRGIGGALVGSFVLSQQDGADCKFSPSPQTSGVLRLSFDNEQNTMNGSLRAEQRGTRPDLRCSLGTANMAWSQTYTATVTQAFTAQQLQSGGKLPLHATGTMNGVGTYSFSNCRTSGGASANCPAGKSDGYSYAIELVGELDLATQTGSGRLVVSNAPLVTAGTWRIPAGPAP